MNCPLCGTVMVMVGAEPGETWWECPNCEAEDLEDEPDDEEE